MIYTSGSISLRLASPNISFSSPKVLSKQIALSVQQAAYNVQVINTGNTQPQIVSNNFGNVAIYKDTTLNLLVQQQTAAGSLEIFFLNDSSITGTPATQMDINQLIVRANPWITNNDIQFYDFSTHCIYLKGNKSQFFENYNGKFFMFNPLLIDKPFVVIASGERCYVGSLHSGLLSTFPRSPYMDELDVGYYPNDVMHISKSWIGSNDIRNDSRIKAVLISLGLYHGGISVNLKSINIIENADTSTVEYVFAITNNDQDNLFVLDPDKMGTERFHYFTNGIVFNGDGGKYQSSYKQVIAPDPYDSWDISWFTQLPVNATIERTVRLR
jgi:hypothetical protein